MNYNVLLHLAPYNTKIMAYQLSPLIRIRLLDISIRMGTASALNETVSRLYGLPEFSQGEMNLILTMMPTFGMFSLNSER